MALINCPDCEQQVSENAPACPKCGSPIAGVKEAAGSGVAQLTTTQGTSKTIKMHTMLASLLVIGGFGLIFTGNQDMYGLAGGMLTIGIVWYLVARFKKWWHHD